MDAPPTIIANDPGSLFEGQAPARSPPSLATAIACLAAGNPIVVYLGESVQHHAARADELRDLRMIKERFVGRAARESALFSAAASQENNDLARLAAYRDDGIFRLEALELAHGRELRQDLRLALKLASRGQQSNVQPALRKPPVRFRNEKKCAEYLLRWQEGRESNCAKCGARSAYFIAARGLTECDACGHQRSIREGTIMARSHLTLRKWFAAICAMRSSPNTSSATLADHLDIARAETVRQMRGRILEALKSPQRPILLAGLDAVFSKAPDPSEDFSTRSDRSTNRFLNEQHIPF